MAKLSIASNNMHLSIDSNKKKRVAIIVIMTIVGMLLLGSTGWCIWKKRVKNYGRRTRLRQMSFELSQNTSGPATEHHSDDESNRGKSLELPLFDMGTIAIAINNFSNANKLGEGGFGTVYKGSRSNIPNLLTIDPTTTGFQIASLPGNNMVKNNVASCGSSISHLYASGLLETTRVNNFYANQLASQNLIPSEHQQKTSGAPELPGPFGGSCFSHHNAPSTWPKICSISRMHADPQETKTCYAQLNCSDCVARGVTDFLPDDNGLVKFDEDGGSRVLPDAHPPFPRDGSSQIQH